MKDKPIAVLASGPSLVESDINLLRAHGIPFIAINSTWQIAPDCLAVVAGDHRWWKFYGREVPDNILRISRSSNAERKHGAKMTRSKIKMSYNSGLVGIEWAIMKGFNPIIMLGFDCSFKLGIHHHGSHTLTPDPTKERLKLWHKQFEELAKVYKKKTIINCSRYTEIKSFPRRKLEDVICELSSI